MVDDLRTITNCLRNVVYNRVVSPVSLIIAGISILLFVSDIGKDGINGYLILPFLHGSWIHLTDNLFFLLVLGSWVEFRIGSVKFLKRIIPIAYISLYAPLFLRYGELAWGLSGLTKALTAYAIPVLFIRLNYHFDNLEFGFYRIATLLIHFTLVVYLFASVTLTAKRLMGLSPIPSGLALSVHVTGICLGIIWFCWRLRNYAAYDI